MIDIGMILARFTHFAGTMVLFGASLFPLYAHANARPGASRDWRTGLLLAAAVVALIGGLFWFAFAAANMAGGLSDLADAEVLWTVIGATNFGPAWAGRMCLATIIVIMTAVRPFTRTAFGQDLVNAVLAAVLLGSLAGTGHSQVEEGWASVAHMLSDATHLLAAGAWLGGLVPLAYVITVGMTDRRELVPVHAALLRFSAMGYVAVATLVGTGLVNSWFLVGSPSNLLTTSYGRALVVKLALFAGMLALAAANRLWLVPALRSAQPDGPKQSMESLRKLRNHVLGEQLLGAMVLLVASLLGTMRPAIGQ
jgi:copper resistance protein D